MLPLQRKHPAHSYARKVHVRTNKLGYITASNTALREQECQPFEVSPSFVRMLAYCSSSAPSRPICNTQTPHTGPRYLWEVADGGKDERSTKASSVQNSAH